MIRPIPAHTCGIADAKRDVRKKKKNTSSTTRSRNDGKNDFFFFFWKTNCDLKAPRQPPRNFRYVATRLPTRRLLFLRDVYLAWIKYIVMSSRRRSIVLRRGHYWPSSPSCRGTPHQKYACLRSGYLSTRSFGCRDILGDVPEPSDGRRYSRNERGKKIVNSQRTSRFIR